MTTKIDIFSHKQSVYHSVYVKFRLCPSAVTDANALATNAILEVEEIGTLTTA